MTEGMENVRAWKGWDARGGGSVSGAISQAKRKAWRDSGKRGESGDDSARSRGPAKSRGEECTMLIRKILVTASLGGLLSIGAPGMLLGQQPKAPPGKPSQPGQQRQQQATKSISGKVTDIGDQGHSFTLEADTGGSMKFVVDRNTQVQGQVKVGMLVAVDYQATEDGQLLCVRVAPQKG